MIFPIGPLINALAIVVASLIGISLGDKLPERIRSIVFQGLGLCTLVLGIQMAILSQNMIIIIFSILLGGIAGEALKLEDRLMAYGNKLKMKIRSNNPKFTEGLVNASVLFCIGAMAILGSLDEGLRGDRTVVYSKAILDAFASIALGAVYGIGVSFSAICVFIYQGIIVIFAGLLQNYLSTDLLNELSALGGVLIIGIGFNLLNLTTIKLSNFMPAIFFVIAICLILGM